MNFYNNSENVDKYIEMCEQYDGNKLYLKLQKHLANGKSLLELGSGPGNDIQFLKRFYKVTGSDLSDEFLKRCTKKFPDTQFLKLDAKTINLPEQFNCIYSNKVLHHLTEEELVTSLLKQKKALT